jgi:transposase
MMNSATPIGVRKAIIRAVHEKGLTYREAAKLIGVGEATVSRVLRRYRETGSVNPRAPRGGNYSAIEGAVASLLHSIVTDMPDATVAELTEALIGRSSVRTSRSSVQRALHRFGLSRKKSPSSRSSETRRSTVSDDESSAR